MVNFNFRKIRDGIKKENLKDEIEDLIPKSEKSNREIEFIKNLDKKLHYMNEGYSHVYGNTKWDGYHEAKMTKKEAIKMLKIVEKGIEKKDLVFYPINTKMGFSVGFSIDEISGFYPLSRKGKVLLRFTESQLPDEYKWEELSEYFNSEENKKMIEHLRMEEIKNRSSYTY